MDKLKKANMLPEIKNTTHFKTTMKKWNNLLDVEDKVKEIENIKDISETLRLNIHIFNPLKKTDYIKEHNFNSNKSNKTIRLLQVKKGQYKPMMMGSKGGAAVVETVADADTDTDTDTDADTYKDTDAYTDTDTYTVAAAAAVAAIDNFKKSPNKYLQDDTVTIDYWNALLTEKLPSDVMIVHQTTLSLDKPFDPKEMKCDAVVECEEITYQEETIKDYPTCSIWAYPIGFAAGTTDKTFIGKYSYYRNLKHDNNKVCFNSSAIDSLARHNEDMFKMSKFEHLYRFNKSELFLCPYNRLILASKKYFIQRLIHESEDQVYNNILIKYIIDTYGEYTKLDAYAYEYEAQYKDNYDSESEYESDS